MPSSFRVAGKSDVGLVRPGNEDFLHIDEQNAVFAVCDGMGGHQAGEVASMMAASTLDTAFNRLSRELLADETLAIGRALPDNGNLLLRAIRVANRGIYTKAAVDPALNGMGTTVVALSLKDDMLSVAHVGDSRAYRLEDRSVTPLTSDHSWVAEIQQQQNITEAEASKMVGKNVITRALGVRDTVEVDYRLIRVKPGDKFILCSDGLCGFADDDEIFSVAHKAREENERMVESLISPGRNGRSTRTRGHLAGEDQRPARRKRFCRYGGDGRQTTEPGCPVCHFRPVYHHRRGYCLFFNR